MLEFVRVEPKKEKEIIMPKWYVCVLKYFI